MISYVESTLAPVVVTVQQDVSAIAQAMAQLENYLIQPWDHLLGIPTGDRGSGSSATTTANSASNHQLLSGTQMVGSGSSSGATVTAHAYNPTPGAGKIKPFTGGGGGGGGGGTDATVSGKVWLDNNGDGFLNNSELGFSGVTVNLWDSSTGLEIATTTTDANGNFQFSFVPQPAPDNNYGILVQFPPGDLATKTGGNSQITAGGYSNAFYTLNPGQGVYILAGLRSMQVTTVQDDPNAPIQNQVTLRDAIETGNNGPPASAVTFVFNQGQGGPAINLQAALPAIATSYNIVGPGSTALTVQGNGNVNTPYRIFTVNSGVTSTISGLRACLKSQLYTAGWVF